MKKIFLNNNFKIYYSVNKLQELVFVVIPIYFYNFATINHFNIPTLKHGAF